MIQRITSILFFLFITLALRSQGEMSLNDCVAYAMANHVDIRIAELNKKDAQWQVKENSAIAYPQINLGVDFNHFIQPPALPAEALGFGDPGQKIQFTLTNNFSGALTLNQIIFDNQYIATIKAAKMYKDYVDIQFNGVVEKLRNKVTDAYIPALIVAEAVRILDKNIATQEKLVGETKANYKAGFVEQLDVDRLEYLLASFKTDRDALIRQQEKLTDVLKYTMNMPVSDSITLKDDVDVLMTRYGDIDPEEQIDYMNRPDYVAVLKALDLNNIQTDALHKFWWPKLSFFGSYNPSFQGNDRLYWIPSSMIGVQLAMPISNGGYYRAKEERSIIQSMKVEEQKRLLTQTYDLQLETARKDYHSTKQKMEDKVKNLALAQRIFDSAETKFRNGLGSSFEVTQAQAGLYQSQGDLVNARFDFLKSMVAFKQALGKNN
jgi:outer membrane protein TolC